MFRELPFGRLSFWPCSVASWFVPVSPLNRPQRLKRVNRPPKRPFLLPVPRLPVPAPEPPLRPMPSGTGPTFCFSPASRIFRGLDYASTRNFQARGREEVLIPDDVVNNSAGFATLEVAGTATSVGLSYWMHRIGHHKIERWISIVHIGVTGFGVARNYSLKSKHATP